MSVRWGKYRGRSKTGPFEPGPDGGLSFLSGKELDLCFSEVVRAILFGVGSCDPNQPLPTKQELFAYVCKAMNVEKSHANKLVTPVSSQIPNHFLQVKVLGARGLSDSPTGCNTFCKLRLLDESDTAPADGDVYERTRTCVDSSNPEWNEELCFALADPENERLQLEVWYVEFSGSFFHKPREAPQFLKRLGHRTHYVEKCHFEGKENGCTASQGCIDSANHPQRASTGRTDPHTTAGEEQRREEASVLKRLVRHFSSTSIAEETQLGILHLAVQDIYPKATTTWFLLDNQQSRDMACHLQLAFRVENLPELGQQQSENIYRLITRSFLRHQFIAQKASVGTGSQSENDPWCYLSSEANYVLSQFAMQRGLSQVVQTALQAEALVQLQSDTQLPTEALGKAYEDLDHQISHKISKLSKAEERVVVHSINTVTDFIFGHFSVSAELFPPKEDGQLEDILHLVELLKRLTSLSLWQSCFPDCGMMEMAVQAKLTIQARIKAWYLSSIEFSVGICQELSGLTSVTQKMIATLSELQQSLDVTPAVYMEVLAGFGENYKAVCLQQAQHLIASDLEKFTQVAASCLNKVLDAKTVSKTSATQLSLACEKLRNLYVITAELQRWLEELQRSDGQDKHLQTLHWPKWFECLLPAWLKELHAHCVQYVNSKLEQEKQHLTASEDKFISHSAHSVLSMLKELPETWKEICSWPDPIVAFMIATRIVDIIADTVRLYVRQLHQEVLSWKISKQSSAFSKGTQICLAVSNMYSMLGALSHRLDWLDWDGMAERISMTERHIARKSPITDYAIVGKALVKGARGDITLLMRRAAKDFLMEMTSHDLPHLMQQLVAEATHLKEESASLNTTALQDYLNQFHTLFHDSPGVPLPAYKIVVLELWDVVLHQLQALVNVSLKEEPKVFQNLHKALLANTGLVGFFRDVMDANLDHVAMDTPTFKELHHQLLVEGSPGSDLPAYHYKELLLFQDSFHAGSRGQVIVTLECSVGQLSGQVRDGKKFPTVNGSCNPYILLELLPASLFHQPSSWKSEVITNRTSPVFDFHFKSVMLQQANATERAVVAITIMHQTAKGEEDILLGQGVLPIAASTAAQSAPTHRGSKKHTLQLLLPTHETSAPLMSLSSLARRSEHDVEASTHHAKLKTIVEMAAISLEKTTPSL